MTGQPAKEANGAGGIRRGAGAVAWLLLDIGIVIGSYALALWLRFSPQEVPAESWRQLAWAGPLIAIAYILAYQMLGVYRTAWQYGSVRDALMLAIAVALVTAAVFTVNVLLPKRPIPLSVNVISAAFIFLFHAMVRMLPRVWTGGWLTPPEFSGQKQRVMVVGAGDTGQYLVADLQRRPNQPYRAVAFIDDDPSLQGKRIHRVPVVGNRNDIAAAVERHKVDVVALALTPGRDAPLQDLLALVEPLKVPVRIVQGPSEVIQGRGRAGEMREITMEDVLARPPVEVDEEQCRQVIEGRAVLITGAAGSIGAELARKVAALNPAALHLLDINETGLYELRNELRQGAANQELIKTWLYSMTDRHRLEAVFEAARPQVVFHLAAYKIVPMMEDHPDQAFETDVLGTLNVFEAARQVGAEQVVFLSSHTAVNPASVYGAAKRIGELLVASQPGPTRFAALRLTNVIDAKGAVLGRFTQQIQQGLPISVTHPDMARFFLTISEVAGLTVQAAALSRGGDIFLVDAGEEVRITDLAERLIRLQGMEPGEDVPIEFVGLRPGDRLRENLIADYEQLQATRHPNVRRVVSSLRFSGAELRAGIRELELDLPRRPVNLPAKLHALARIDREEPVETPRVSEPGEPPVAPLENQA
ncbi:MAG TPA: SDR family NAD(P)-dependent oxidoreductase [Dehalococcoidia bacterium]|nr:SDR family NAD(P)-dependent oxidoreductase [Dehalococcoidia bacterium]